MALTPGNLKAGGMRWYWDTGGSEVELGLSVGESELVIEQGGSEWLTEQFGVAPVDYLYDGERVTLRLQLAESRNDLLLILLQGSTQSTGPTTKAWQFGSVPGLKASTIAKQLRGHVARTATQSDASDDIHLYLAAPLFVSEPISLRRQRIYTCTFLALVDTSKSDGNLLGRWKTDAA